MATRVGGRQGCKFGACLFNSTFSVALFMIHDVLVQAGIVLQVRCDDAAPWRPAPPGADGVPTNVLDAAFVDDTALILFAASSRLLDSAIETLLKHVQDHYTVLNLEINWNVGKTEAFLIYRGHEAAQRTRARRPPGGGPLSIPIPGTASTLSVVSQYKHLGGEIAASGSLVPLAQGRRRRALAAYAPLAMKVFGSCNIVLDLKQWLFQTLIMSRLMYNLHVVVPTRHFVSILNDVYMRGHRRMHGATRAGPGGETDLEFRERIRLPSLDCILARARLRYLGRLLRSRPPALLALLRQRPRSRRPGWLDLIVDDLRRLRLTVALCAALPDPDDHPEEWSNFVLADPLRWKQSVAMLHFVDSLCDVRALPDDAQTCRPHVCTDCHVAFATAKQLAQHRRIKHGERCPQRFYAPASGICPACHTTFGTRLALLSHLCDSRRNACWNAITRNPKRYAKMPATTVEALDDVDREARNAARKSGHTHALATGGCVRSDGTHVGRPTT